ncbi:glucan 1,3-alpha-glucosidase ROT2 [Lachancea thermotolerans CBS 6340]|uniref:Glucosidase II subunit alpha n=1 Tax=Lachancea thermotolerans (strain ATCC 56472 / CBS 6340 / NRRL Y-8284) TaxID=559295 RepID=C5E2N2_LACTC|nr:KLTH0H06336p [Lachancea thermotolerans CBS 6340]CAR30293.1 KLTH0H06336p [Lachancea thermotolerans CBS 6340]
MPRVCRKLQLALILVSIGQVLGFTDYLLKSCSQSGFCQRNRHYASEIERAQESPYSLDPASIQISNSNHTFQATIQKSIPDLLSFNETLIVELPVFVDVLDGGKVRFRIDERRETNNTYVPEILNPKRYDEASLWAFQKDAKTQPVEVGIEKSLWSRKTSVTFIAPDSQVKIRVFLKQFRIEFYFEENLVLVVNDRLLLNVEHLRTPEENTLQKLPEELTFNDFEDDFEYSKKDTLPFGPESVALDFTFVGVTDVFGIPEHADSLKLKDTRDGEPYRLFNADVFEYSLGARTPMYGAIPFMIGSTPDFSAGIFWVNAADTWVDINYSESSTGTHWMSEAGTIDVIIFLAKTPQEVTSAYTEITGRPQLPLSSSIGYHQCRWNYNDERDVLTVDSQMDKAGIPYDYIWLDLEYTDDKKFFTWKPDAFPDPRRMLKKLHTLGRNLVTLIDPHLKVDYSASNTVEKSGASVRNSLGASYHGHCWPGESIWIDTIGKNARKVWGKLMSNFLQDYNNLHIWNDMNEPSVFSGPETTAPKDLIHDGGFEERSIHNLYGLTVHEATYNAMRENYGEKNRRPFILSRSFFAGSQRTAATWTGDNVANWEYLKISIPMCLSNNVAGFPFIGADIAGFSGNPTTELLARWYQAGMWYPFFRGHAHIDAARREPYLFEEPLKSIVKDAILLRYSLMPTFYTAFYESSTKGSPIMNPVFFVHPELHECYGIDDQFYIGSSGLLVKPVTEQGATEVQVFFPAGQFYEFDSLKAFSVQEPSYLTIDAPIDKQPISIEGGHILFKKERYRRSSKLMEHDPYTLVIAPDVNGKAEGTLYIDDGETFAFQDGEYMKVAVKLENDVLESTVTHMPTKFPNLSTHVERIIVGGGQYSSGPNRVTLKKDKTEWILETKISKNGHHAIIENPHLDLSKPWSLEVHR